MNAILIFASTFILVFALGFQSLNVNNGHYKAAFFTSFAIALSNLVLFKTIPQAGLFEISAYLVSGPFAIVSSMWTHKRFIKSKVLIEPIDAPNGNVKNYNQIPQTTPETRA